MLKTILPKSRAFALFAAIGVLFLVTHILYHRPASPIPPTNLVTLEGGDLLPCQQVPYSDDVVVILRTGATEIEDKLPMHLETTFQCYNDLIVFSDYAETFGGHPIFDVLESLDNDWKETHEDFDIYRRLQREGRAGLKPEELSGSDSFEGSKSGKRDNPGWKLDKWKFLPMMRETLKLRPDKKWYVFLEPDSYVVWSNLQQWLNSLDPSKALYYGSENQIGPDVYAHGGSVFVMSKSAVQAAADSYAKDEEGWDRRVAGHWAGDCILGIVLREAGVELTWSWPMLQGGHPEKMDFSEEKHPTKKLWCAPALSYHHFSPTELERMWQFEQSWIQARQQAAANENRKPWQNDGKDILHHRELFRQFILPNITTEWYDWNNLSPDLVMPRNANAEACRHLCEQSPECVQFSVGEPGCSISTNEVMLGQRASDYRSYWVMDRIYEWMNKLDSCEGLEGWAVT